MTTPDHTPLSEPEIAALMNEAIKTAEREDRGVDVGPIYQEGDEVVGVRIDGKWHGKQPAGDDGSPAAVIWKPAFND